MLATRQTKKKNALETYTSLNKQLEKLSDEVKRLIGEAEIRGENLKREILDSARKRGEMIIKEGRMLALRETGKAQDYLKKNLVRLSVELAEVKIRARLTKKEHLRLVDNCIKQIEGL